MDEDAPPAVRFSSFSPVFMVRDLPRALAHYAALGFAVEPVAGGVPYGFADRDGVSLHLTAEHARAGARSPTPTSSSPTWSPPGTAWCWSTGPGRAGVRAWTLAFLLYAEGARDLRRVNVVLVGYRRHVSLTEDELGRLAGLIRARPLVLSAWSVCTGRLTPSQAVTGAAELTALAGSIAERTRAALAG